MPGVPVHLDRAPHSVFLLAWGRAPDAWWGLVQFQQRVRGGDDEIRELPVAAWVPAATLTRPGWASTAVDLPRIALFANRDGWPPPSCWPYWYAGPWPNGPLRLPEGSAAFNGSAWRKGSR